LRAPPPKTVGKRVATSSLCARLNTHFTLHTQPDGSVAASVNGYAIELGKFSAETVKRAADLRGGLRLSTITSTGAKVREINQLVRRLAHLGLLEYPLKHPRDDRELAVIEPQAADYWPQPARLNDTDAIVLSRLAYLRRRGSEMVLESPRASALFRICDSRIANLLAVLSTPQTMTKLRRLQGFPGTELFALLLSCQILFKVGKPGDDGRRASEGDQHLVLWDFHDLLFHARSTEGRQANPLGGLYAHAGAIAPLPAVRPPWPGQRIDLVESEAITSHPVSSFTSLLHARRSIRSFDDVNPITLVELSRLLDAAARIRSTWTSDLDFGETGPVMTYAARPYPGAGSAYELELYLAVANCAGLARGFYHYDADAHALVPITVNEPQLEAMLMAAAYAMDAPSQPQILMTVAARFGRVSWKYSSVAYSLILKDAGVLLQTLYLTATDMGLGGCAIGTNNIELFAKMTGLEFHVEGPVAQFALGRAANQDFEAYPAALHSDSDD
jgi:SagB-type dehydrogenase family enzyme